MEKSKLIYSTSGCAYPDYLATDIAKALKFRSRLDTSTENIIFAFRVLIKEGYFTPDEVEVLYRDRQEVLHPIHFDDRGNPLAPFPPGFCDTTETFSGALL